MSTKKSLLILVVFFVVIFFSLPVGAQDNGIPVLAYHLVNDMNNDLAVSPQEFNQQMTILKEAGFQTISIEQLCAYVKGEKVSLPEKPFLLTFDDGYLDNYTNAFPILQEHGFQANIFIIAEKINKSGYLTIEQMNEMSKENIIIGVHSMTHSNLTLLDAFALEKEVGQSKHKIEKKLGKKVIAFAYPYGAFNLESFEQMRKAGYQGAFSLLTGLNRPYLDSVYLLRRIPVFRYTDFAGLLLKLEENKAKESLFDYVD